MKYAAAMKYGGELVSAIGCDYASFKQLVPLCPECKEPVFLRKEFRRESSITEGSIVQACWCHFRKINSQDFIECENRVNSYSSEKREQLASESKGQRLKLLNKWFWDVWLNYQTDADCNSLFWDPQDYEPISQKLFRAVKKNIETRFYKLKKDNDLLVAYLDGRASLFDPSVIDLKIAFEAIDFLIRNRQKELLVRAITVKQTSLFFYWRFATGNNEDGDSPYEEWVGDPCYLGEQIISSCISVPWADAFLELEEDP